MNKATFNIIHSPTDEGVCPRYALFGNNGYNTVLVGNRALKRHPENFLNAWDNIKEDIRDTYGFNHDGNNIPWVAQKHYEGSITTLFFKGDKMWGAVNISSDGEVLISHDYEHNTPLMPHIEEFARSIS